MEEAKGKGNEAVKAGDFAQALDHYKQAIAIAVADPARADDLAALHSNCSFAHLKLGQLIEALDEAIKSVHANSKWSKAHFRCGEVYFAMRDYARAEEAYAQAAQLSPADETIGRKLRLTREAVNGNFYFRQLLAGRDFCLNPGNIIETQIFNAGAQMQNYVYLVGDAKTREAVVVDPAWDVKGIKAFADAEHIKLVGAVATHYHFDHTGGPPPPPFDRLMIKLPGVRQLAVEDNLPIYVNKHDAGTIKTKNEVPAQSIVELDDLSTVMVGSVKLEFIHTPGHTPGSQCIRINRAPAEDILISGDTLFISSCGRLDLPDCSVEAMYTSLQKKLASLPDSTRVYPGHNYGGPSTSIANEKKHGFLRPMSEREWLQQHRL
ncbi:hypothetical protein SELMODRAFT_447638 [Selaginella moellendorffii]|uniref:Metallo-beta-lactamase domain-containing protein n=1 Tax=Selaginella moellendorffii TaxID=88036 RepID=D8T150_SELML|nr:uncharacterized protein LOC9650436 isoform X1 [Selaginella moellendorffii]EFJ09576.1 hypothetical protein SELMODRAFT_447638 [Selaginella moellendorffii]|eukprot:XP_002989302.1 uncharacterized protein LOC9650436 isoform X1 [Selaginella moellendorffii]